MEIFLGIAFSIAVCFPMIAVGISGILESLPSVKRARNDAEEIRAKAEQNAKEIRSKAEKDADETRSKAEQTVNETKKILSDALKDFSNKNIISNLDDYLYSISVGRLGNIFNSEINILSLGIDVKASIKAQSEPDNYNTTLNDCTCKDFLVHHKPCKHMLFLTYNFGLLYAEKDNIEKQLKSSILKLDENIKENKKTIKKLEATEKRSQNKKALPKQS